MLKCLRPGCPHLQAKLPQQLQATAAVAGAPAPAPSPVTVDFGPADAPQQPQQPEPAAVAAPRLISMPAAAAPTFPALRPVSMPAAAAPTFPVLRPVAAAATRQYPQLQPVAQRPAAQSSPAAARATVAASPAAGGIPSRLAGRLGPAVAKANDDHPSSKTQVGGSLFRCLLLQGLQSLLLFPETVLSAKWYIMYQFLLCAALLPSV